MADRTKDRTGRILVVDDNEDILFAADMLLGQLVAEVRTESDPRAIPDLLAKQRFDVILLDMNFTKDVTSGREGFHWLGRILDIDPAAIVILITAFADFQTAVQAVKAGATDFVAKPWENEKLLATVSSALALSRERRTVRNLRSRQRQLSEDLDQPFQDFIGESPAIQKVRAMITKVAATDANVLITGENGTGKELVARAVHRLSNRSAEVFVRVDLGALTGTLFEGELFGHVKGAFTDAKGDRPGRFEVASGGTLFLDEIGSVPLDLQPKLLSALQDRQIIRVGANTPRPVDIRLISATNLSLTGLVARGDFRQDLLYRINTVEIPIPPLRERRSDVGLLAYHFLGMYARKYRKNISGIRPAAMRNLETYGWPGNVRELQHAIERAVIMSGSADLDSDDFLLARPASSDERVPLDTFNLQEIEKAIIRRAMERFDGNVSRVARELGVSRPALYRRLKDHGI